MPALHHLLNVDERPAIWRRNDYGYDWERGEILVMEFSQIPDGLNTRERRMYYNTERLGNSAAGHIFPDDYLSDDEKIAIMEYLKTL